MIIRLKLLVFIFILLNGLIFCEENKTSDDFVYDYGSGDGDVKTSTESNSSISTDEPKDDFVYDYGSEDDKNETSSTSKPSNDTELVNDDYVYDYGSGEKDNETDITTVSPSENTTDLKSFVTYDNSSELLEVESEGIPESDISSSTTTTEETSDESSDSTESNDYDDDEEGGSEGDVCHNENIITKIRAIFDENRNYTFVKHVNHINDTFARINHIRDLYNRLIAPDKRTGVELLGFVSSVDVTLSPECFASFFAAITGYRKGELWAQKFVDSSGRFWESGSVEGKHSSFGEYDGCLEIESPDTKGLIVKGQYCMARVILPYPKVSSYKKGDPYDQTWDEAGHQYFREFNGQNLTTLSKFIEGLNIYNGTAYRIGLCTPHLCKPPEIEEFLNKFLYPITHLPIEIPKCDREDKTEDFKTLELIAMAILVILAILVITSTGIEIYDIIYIKSITEDNKNLGDVKFEEDDPFVPNPYFYIFSLVTNSRALYSKNNRFASLDTIRLFIIIHIYVLHLYNTMSSMGIITLKRSFSSYPSRVLYLDRYSTLRNSLSFDALFAMSGFILANCLLGKLSKSDASFNYFKYLGNRWLRFSVPLLGSIIFFNILPLLGSGPVWAEGVNWVMRGCESPLVVLSGFLYLSNFNDQFGLMKPRMASVPYCNPPTWFISVLFQLHIITPIFILIFAKNKKHGLYATVAAIVIGMLLCVTPTIIFKIVPQVQYLQIETFEDLMKSFLWYNLSTSAYIVSFFVGVLGAYLLRKNIRLNIEHEVILWVGSIFGFIITFMWNNTFWKLEKSAPLYSVLLWFTFGKLIYCSAFTWVFFALCTGRAQWVNRLLSWSNFQPFARLSFAFYMVHYIIVMRRVFNVKDTIHMTDGLMIEYSIIDIMVSFCLAYIFYAMIESPFSNLMTLWLSKSETEVKKNGIMKSNNINRDFGHSNDIELEENINSNNNTIQIEVEKEKTVKI